MAITIIVTNNLGSSINLDDLGVSLSTSEIRNLTDTFDITELVESTDLYANVASGALGVNDGSVDLSINDGLAHINIESEYQDLEQDSSIGGGTVPTDLAYVYVGTTTQFQLNPSWTDTEYTTLGVENDNSVLEWDTINKDRVLIKENGLYEIFCGFFPRTNSPSFVDSYYRIRSNDNTVLGQEYILNTYVSEVQNISISESFELMAGDFISVQTRTNAGDNIDIMSCSLSIKKLEGIKGDDGAPGGTTIEIQDNGTTVTTNTDSINFVGDSVTVTDSGNNTATVTINDSSHVFKYANIHNTNGNININVTPPVAYPWNSQTIRDVDTFDHSIIVRNTRLYVLKSGWYKVSYLINYDNGGNSRVNIRCAIRKNGDDALYIPQTITASYIRNNTDDYMSNALPAVLVHLNANDYIELMHNREGSSTTTTTYADQCWLQMEFCRED